MADAKQMTGLETEAFIARLPWRHVKMVPVGHGLTDEEAIRRWGEFRHIAPDPHEYVIKEWREVDDEQFGAFVELVRATGYRGTYRAPYRPDHEMRNHYLEIDGWCYWFIYPNMLNRERAEHREHEPRPGQVGPWLLRHRLIHLSGDIFLLRGEDDLVPMAEAPYDTEDVLQELLAKFPHLLAGDQLAGTARRWILIERESAVPDAEASAGRWSLDHLFLDQDSVPTLVEVKRSSDTRIRREVVGQLIDYAANAVVYWPAETLRAAFEARLEREELDADAELAAVPDQDADIYWEQAAANLKAGRIRLVFVADRIPRELARVVEFLNEQMAAEVIAIEVKQYVGPDGLRTLVPRAIGQTAVKSSRPSRRRIDRASLLEDLAEVSPEAVTAGEALLDWGEAQGDLEVRWTAAGDIGLQSGSPPVLRVWPEGTIEVKVDTLRKLVPQWNNDDRVGEFFRRLEIVDGVSLKGDRRRWPRTELAPLADQGTRRKFLAIVDELFRDLRPAARRRLLADLEAVGPEAAAAGEAILDWGDAEADLVVRWTGRAGDIYLGSGSPPFARLARGQG